MDSSIVTLMLSSSFAVAVVTAAKELVLWYLNRRASNNDKHDELTERVNNLSDKDSQQSVDLKEISAQLAELKATIDKNDEITKKSLRLLFGDRIHHLALSYISKGEVTFEEKEALTRMWGCYHYDLGGNGTYDDLMKHVAKLRIVV